MGLKVHFDPIATTLTAVGKDATNAAYQSLVDSAKEIRDLAREMAPVDDGELEKAIIESHDKAEKRVEIGIDLNAVDAHGKQVASYGLLMHEGLAPHGSGYYKLGKLSQAKDAGRGIVGGKFLERAFEEMRKSILQKVTIAVKRVYRES